MVCHTDPSGQLTKRGRSWPCSCKLPHPRTGYIFSGPDVHAPRNEERVVKVFENGPQQLQQALLTFDMNDLDDCALHV